MREITVHGWSSITVSSVNTCLNKPHEGAQILTEISDVSYDCDYLQIDSKYLNGSDSDNVHVYGEAATAFDRAFELAFGCMVSDERVALTIKMTSEYCCESSNGILSCIACLHIVKNKPHVYEIDSAERISMAQKYKEIGVEVSKERTHDRTTSALFLFSRALKWLSIINPTGGNVKDVNLLKVQCLNNVALMHLDLKHYELVIQACSAVLCIEENNVKSLYRRSVANTSLQNYEAALADINCALKLEPQNIGLQKHFQKIKLLQKRLDDHYAKAMSKFLNW